MDRPVKTAKPPPLSLQDAKAHFSEVVGAAMRGQPQHVTRRGEPAVVIVGAADFERLSRAERVAQPTFVDHLLAIPKTPKGERPFEPRVKIRLRDVDFSK